RHVRQARAEGDSRRQTDRPKRAGEGRNLTLTNRGGLPPPPLRIVFMRTPAPAAPVAASLLDGPDPGAGVFTRPDAASGRGLRAAAPPVAERARSAGIPVEQPRGWKDGSATEALRAFAPDLVVVAAYGRLLPQAAL